MQASHASLGADLTEVARGFGIARVRTVTALDQLDDLATAVADRPRRPSRRS